MGVQTNTGSSDAHAQWFFCWIREQMIMMSLQDVMRISQAIEGGNYKRRAGPSLEAVIAVVWVFWY